MYESPITLYDQIPTIMTAFDAQKDNYVCECVERIGVNVNKEELLRALSYDREQYNKGYEDGRKDIIEEIEELIRNNGAYEMNPMKGSDEAFEIVMSILRQVKEPINRY